MRLSIFRIRPFLLVRLLLVVVAFAIVKWSGHLGGRGASSGGVTLLASCPVADAPTLSTVSRAQLSRLRDDVGRVVSFDSRLRPYEQGLVGATVVWSDAEPDAYAALSLGDGVAGSGTDRGRHSTHRRRHSADRRKHGADGDGHGLAAQHVPGGYEMRWWMPNGDDLVADGFLFASANEAQNFLRQATKTDCRSRGSVHDAAFPAGGHNLGWVNPDHFAQQDLYIRRDRRVYRVAVVKAGVSDSIASGAETEAFALVDGLACFLPGTSCRGAADSTPSTISA
jgi:hypothetical protein